MKGYTIENSIDLLEKDVKALKEGGGGGGGASTWNQLQGKPFSSLGEELYNLDGDLTVNTISADKIALPDSTEHSWDYLSQAIEALAEDVNHFSDDIAELETSKANVVNYSTEEVNTGIKYVDGKTIYQKTITGLYAPSSSSSVSVYDTGPEIDVVIGIEIQINAPTHSTFVGGGALLAWHQRVRQGNVDPSIRVQISNGTYYGQPMIVTIRYTKNEQEET